MLARAGKWALVALVGLLVIGAVAMGVAYAQAPTPTRTPQAGCPFPQGGMAWRMGGSMLQTLAEALGMTPEALAEALRSGKTVTDLAKEKNVTIAQLVDKLIAARQTALQQAVQAGRITQQQADDMLARMREQMTEHLQNGTCAPGTGCGVATPGQGCGAMGRGGRWGANGQPQPGANRPTGRPGMRWTAPSQPA